MSTTNESDENQVLCDITVREPFSVDLLAERCARLFRQLGRIVSSTPAQGRPFVFTMRVRASETTIKALAFDPSVSVTRL